MTALPREKTKWSRKPRAVFVMPYTGLREELVLRLEMEGQNVKGAVTDMTAQEVRDLITILQFKLVEAGEEL